MTRFSREDCIQLITELKSAGKIQTEEFNRLRWAAQESEARFCQYLLNVYQEKISFYLKTIRLPLSGKFQKQYTLNRDSGNLLADDIGIRYAYLSLANVNLEGGLLFGLANLLSSSIDIPLGFSSCVPKLLEKGIQLTPSLMERVSPLAFVQKNIFTTNLVFWMLYQDIGIQRLHRFSTTTADALMPPSLKECFTLNEKIMKNCLLLRQQADSVPEANEEKINEATTCLRLNNPLSQRMIENNVELIIEMISKFVAHHLQVSQTAYLDYIQLTRDSHEAWADEIAEVFNPVINGKRYQLLEMDDLADYCQLVVKCFMDAILTQADRDRLVKSQRDLIEAFHSKYEKSSLHPTLITLDVFTATSTDAVKQEVTSDATCYHRLLQAAVQKGETELKSEEARLASAKQALQQQENNVVSHYNGVRQQINSEVNLLREDMRKIFSARFYVGTRVSYGMSGNLNLDTLAFTKR